LSPIRLKADAGMEERTTHAFDCFAMPAAGTPWRGTISNLGKGKIMLMNGRNKRMLRWGAALVFMLAALPGVVLAQSGGIDPQAEKLLKASTAFLASQKQFSVSTQNTIEAVLTSGQKLQFDNAATLLVQRPNKLRAERRGDLVDQTFLYDGKSLTLVNPGDKVYATVDAPGTVEGMLDFARDSLDIIAPAGDLIYSNAFDILMQDVTSGFVVGKSVVGGVRCDHLAFRTPQADWQIWIQEGKQPLPRKMVITSTDVENAPQFSGYAPSEQPTERSHLTLGNTGWQVRKAAQLFW
jgi:hypothetical protein